MLRKLAFIFLIICIVPNIALATLGIRAHYFFPTDSVFKSIYGSGIKYEAEFQLHVKKNLWAWFDIAYYARKGNLTFSNEETKLAIIPISLGIQRNFSLGALVPYLGIGLQYNFFNESNYIGEEKAGGIGFVAKAGVLIPIYKKLKFDLQAVYSYCSMKPADLKFNIGGFELGVGISINFP